MLIIIFVSLIGFETHETDSSFSAVRTLDTNHLPCSFPEQDVHVRDESIRKPLIRARLHRIGRILEGLNEQTKGNA